MKKGISISLAFILTLLIGFTNISAAPKGENKTFNDVKVEYNSSTKELYAYGYNKYGNLGAGNNATVSKANKVKINDKIGNKNIVDYVFFIHSTYVLSEDGNVYASGLEVGNGYKQTNKFVKLNFYNESKNKITNLSTDEYYTIIDKEDIKDCKNHVSFCETSVNMGTQHRNISYMYTNSYNYSMVSWIESASFIQSKTNELVINAMYISKYPVYIYDGPKTLLVNNVNAKGQLTKSVKTNVKSSYVEQKNYKNNKITNYYLYTNNKRVLKRYNNNKVTYQRTTTYLNGKSIKKRRIKVDTTYKYKNGYGVQATTKKRMNNKLKLYSKTDYKRNKKGELKSNKYGKAYKNVRYYKNGKVKSKYQYTYNSKGKIVKKKVIK